MLRARDGSRSPARPRCRGTSALIVVLGSAKCPDCPIYDTSKVVAKGELEKVYTAFLVPEGQKPAAVQVTRGYYKKPLEWPVAS